MEPVPVAATVADLTLPPEFVRGIEQVLNVHAAEFGVDYCWVRQAATGQPFGVVMTADEFRRLKAAAGEPIGETA